MLLILPVLLGLTVANWSRRFDETLVAKVNGELTIAHQHLEQVMEGRLSAIAALGQSAAMLRVSETGDDQAVRSLLQRERQRLGLDFLYLIDPGGQVISSTPLASNVGLADWPVAAAALAGTPRVAIDIFAPEELARYSQDLVERARFQLLPTPAAVLDDRENEGRGMLVHAAAPAIGGALVGGLLLNRNLDFIDEINELVYPAASLTEGSQGTATLFLDDVRISTNVRMFDGVRALGTRVSAAVWQRVLGEGHVWLDRAFVVNAWYVSAYEPIVDSFGNRVGMLYVGFLEAPYSEARWRTVRQVALWFLVILALSVPVLLRWAHGIFAPLERMSTTLGLVESGDLGARTGPVARADEIGRVSAHLDTLLDRLQERDRRLREMNEELEARVAARTADLEEANRQLKATTAQLIVSEKLASIGEITAGVAHEINNPLAVIQGNLDVILSDLGSAVEPLGTEFRLIQEQIQTIHILISKLLQFARPEEFAESSGHSPNQAINDTLPLVHHMLPESGLDLRLDLAATRLVGINPTELQQVLINILTNGIQAMPDGGRLTITTADIERDLRPAVQIIVRDTGAGIPDTVIDRIFDPFFTTKRGAGTGLGLSISRKLIERAGGNIAARTEAGRGTVFEIVLPALAQPAPANPSGA